MNVDGAHVEAVVCQSTIDLGTLATSPSSTEKMTSPSDDFEQRRARPKRASVVKCIRVDRGGEGVMRMEGGHCGNCAR